MIIEVRPMKRNWTIFALLLLGVVAVQQLAAANHYVRAGATGIGNGTDWTNAWTDLPSSFARGDTYYVAAGSYGVHTFAQATVGSLWIYVKKAIASDHGTNSGWTDSYGVGSAVFPTFNFSSDYWDINGQAGSGRSGYGIEVNSSSTNLITINANYIALRYCNIHEYAEGSTHAQLIAGNFWNLVYSVSGNTNLTISHCYLHHVFGSPFVSRALNTVLIEYCYIANNAGTGANHCEGLSDALGTSNVTIRYNKWCDIENTAFIGLISGSAPPRAATNWDIYGNVFWHTGWGTGVSAIITVIDDASDFNYAVNWHIYNNTAYMIRGYFNLGFNSTSTNGVVIENNIIYQNRPDSTSAANYGYINFGASGTYDYNYWGLCNFIWAFGNAAHENPIYDGANCRLSDAPGFPGFVDAANEDFHLNGPISGYPGLPLSSPYDQDMDGKIRGSGGVWTRGAFEVGSSTPPALSAPHGLRLK
jgi:hypothetical protein